MVREDAVVHRSCTPVVDARFDPVNGPPLSEAIVDALARAADREPTELPPLYRAVDLEALEILLDPDRADAAGVYTFTYEGYQIFVSADGRIRVCDPTRPTAPTPVFADD